MCELQYLNYVTRSMSTILLYVYYLNYVGGIGGDRIGVGREGAAVYYIYRYILVFHCFFD